MRFIRDIIDEKRSEPLKQAPTHDHAPARSGEGFGHEQDFNHAMQARQAAADGNSSSA